MRVGQGLPGRESSMYRSQKHIGHWGWLRAAPGSMHLSQAEARARGLSLPGHMLSLSVQRAGDQKTEEEAGD